MTFARGGRHPRAGGDQARVRVFTLNGVYWKAREVASALGGSSRPDLVFESEQLMRRVREYPDDWLQLDDGALFALSFSR